MFTSLARVIKAGCLNSWRNKWLSVATILVMGLAIFGITNLLLINVLIDSLITNLEDKIDVSVYFNLGVSEEQILSVRDSLIGLSQVKNVEYVSTEEALNSFKEKHKDNQVLMQSLQELDNNPLEAALNIKAQVTSQYASIVDFLDQEEYQEIIDKVNYQENRTVIARLSSITTTVRQVGFVILLILAILAILVTFNTVRLTIYSARKEIKVMKLVGASNWFIRGPFIVEGAIYGVIAVALTLAIVAPLLWYFSPRITGYLPGTDLFYFFQTNFLTLLLVQLIVGILMGTVSSLVAVRRYLEN